MNALQCWHQTHALVSNQRHCSYPGRWISARGEGKHLLAVRVYDRGCFRMTPLVHEPHLSPPPRLTRRALRAVLERHITDLTGISGVCTAPPGLCPGWLRGDFWVLFGNIHGCTTGFPEWGNVGFCPLPLSFPLRGRLRFWPQLGLNFPEILRCEERKPDLQLTI